MMTTPREFMRRGIVSIFCLAIFLSAAACAPTAPPPTLISTAPTVLVPFTPDAPDLQFPTLLPTVTLGAPQTATPVVVIVTATPSPTPTATLVPVRAPTKPRATATPAESATPLPEGIPQVFVTALRVEPLTPKANEGGTFFVTFQNLSGRDDGYDWAVEIWDVDNDKRPFGLTAPQNSPMPQGVTTLTSTGWTVKGLGECHGYRARVIARDDEDNRSTFIQPDGSILWLDFTVCP